MNILRKNFIRKKISRYIVFTAISLFAGVTMVSIQITNLQVVATDLPVHSTWPSI